MIAIKSGTTSYRAISDVSQLLAGEVAYEGEYVFDPDGFTSRMVWDAGLNNVRAMTAPEIAAIPTTRAQTAKAAATASIDTGSLQAGTEFQRLFVAEVGMTLKEFNLHALKMNAILDAADNSATFALFKTAMAAIADYPPRTKAQLVTAVKTEIAATAE